MKRAKYQKELRRLQAELFKLQEWVVQQDKRVVVIFEGRDAAGKGSVITRITESLNPRVCRVAALARPTERERTQWYFQRYAAHLPSAGEIVLFDRSWYNRAGVERVMGFCSEQQYWEFLRSCPEFENMLVREGIDLVKYWFSVGPEEQARRFRQRLDSPVKRWKFSDMDLQSYLKWEDYSHAKDRMMAYTDTDACPWYVVRSDSKRRARLNCIHHLLRLFPYRYESPEAVELPERQIDPDPDRPPIDSQRFVPDVF